MQTKKSKRDVEFKKIIKRVREGPCYPRDLYKDENLKLKHRTVDANLRRGLRLEIFRKLEDGRYAWIDYRGEDDIKEALGELRFIFGCPYPPIEYIVSHPKTGKETEKIKPALYKLGWHEPTSEEKHIFEENRKRLSIWAWELAKTQNSARLSDLDPGLVERVKLFHKLYPKDVRPNKILSPYEQHLLGTYPREDEG